MPIRDRLWWLWAGGALLAAVASVAIPYAVVSHSMSLDDRLGQSHIQTFLFGGFLALVLLILTAVLTAAAVFGRKRTALRKRALRGDLSAIPVADLDVDPNRAPEVVQEPLAVYWRATKTKRAQAPLYILLIGVQGLIALAMAGLQAVVFAMSLLHPDNAEVEANRLWIALVFVVILLLVGLLVGVFAAMSRYIPTLYGRPYGVTARGDGIECHTEFGRAVFIPWGEMRLLEVEGSRPNALGLERRDYRLYGVNGVAAWHDNPAKYSEFAPDGISSGEMGVRLRALLDLINARTGLVPRTLSRDLQVAATKTTRAGSAASSSSSPTIASALLGMATLGIATAVLLVPLTPLPALNLASAASLVGGALALFAIGVRTPFVDRASRRELRTAVQSVALPPGYASDAVYVLRYDMLSPRSRLALALLGLLLLANLPGLLVMPLAPLAVIFDWASRALGWLPGPASIALAVVVGIYGIVGLGILIVAWKLGSLLLRVDANGISLGIGRGAITLTWARVETMAARPRPGASAAYVVEGDAGRTSVEWPIHPKYPRALSPGEAATAVTSSQLAAVAQERAGLRLTVEQWPDKR